MTYVEPTYFETEVEHRNIMLRRIPDLDKEVNHPVQCFDFPVFLIMDVLESKYGWSREDIADWLDDINPSEALLSFYLDYTMGDALRDGIKLTDEDALRAAYEGARAKGYVV